MLFENAMQSGNETYKFAVVHFHSIQQRAKSPFVRTISVIPSAKLKLHITSYNKFKCWFWQPLLTQRIPWLSSTVETDPNKFKTSKTKSITTCSLLSLRTFKWYRKPQSVTINARNVTSSIPVFNETFMLYRYPENIGWWKQQEDIFGRTRYTWCPISCTS